MSKRVKPFLGGIFICSLILFSFSPPTDKYFDIAQSLDIFISLFKEVNTYYVDEVDPQKMIDTGLIGMLAQLDPYTNYIPENDKENFSIQSVGQYAGIGALIGAIQNKIVITHPYWGYPAQRAGLKVGDELISINGKNIQGKSTDDVKNLLKGPIHTDVEIKVKRLGLEDFVKTKVSRENIKIPNVVYKGLLDTAIGYIKLDDFTPGAREEIQQAIHSLKIAGAKNIILDLRDNLGGSLYEAINVVNVFIPQGKEVVSTKSRISEWTKTYHTLNKPIDSEIPLVVLISTNSASASEIVAGALQDYDRAVLVGQKSFGKGLVQVVRQIDFNAQLKLTVAKYYIPSGRCIQALNYTPSHSDKKGNSLKDSVKQEFRTQSGRKVFDGGGIDPDQFVEPDEEYGSFLTELISNGFLFEYASRYCSQHPTAPTDLKIFRLSDTEYQHFVEWMKTTSFSHASALEKEATVFIKNLQKESSSEELKIPLEELSTKISYYQSTYFTRLKPLILHALEQQIAFHYKLTVGQIDVSLRSDQEIEQAKKILANKALYKKLLTPQ